MAFNGMTPHEFVVTRVRDTHLTASDYIFYEFTPEEAFAIDDALFKKDQYRFYSKLFFKNLRDDWSRAHALRFQTDYLASLEALKEFN